MGRARAGAPASGAHLEPDRRIELTCRICAGEEYHSPHGYQAVCRTVVIIWATFREHCERRLLTPPLSMRRVLLKSAYALLALTGGARFCRAACLEIARMLSSR